MIVGYTPGVPVLGTVSTVGAGVILLGGYAVIHVLRRRRGTEA
jgi:spermidine/putrescine transport system permease protein